MTITRGSNIKNLALYPPAQPSLTIIKTNKQPISYLTVNIRSPLTIEDALDFKDQTKDDIISSFIHDPSSLTQPTFQLLNTVMDEPNHDSPVSQGFH